MRRMKALRWLNILLVIASLLALLTSHANPTYLWPLAFLGLAAPFLLFFHLLFLVFWLVRKDRYLFFSLGTLILSWTVIQGLFGIHGPAEEGKQALRLATFNAHMLRGQDGGEVDLEVLTREIRDWAPEVLAMQEFPQRPDARAAAIALLENMGLDHYTPHPEGRGSLMVFSKYPLKTTDYQSENRVNGYQLVEIQGPETAWTLMNVHLNSNYVTGLANELADKGDLREKETWVNLRQMLARYRRAAIRRSDQARRIQKIVATHTGPLVVCGDFNDTARSFTYRTIKGPLRDAFLSAGSGLGATYAGNIPGLRIDYILVDPALQVYDCRRAPRTYSDHYPLIAEISLP